MNRYPDKKRRDRLIAGWPVSQSAMILGMVLSVVMPFAWGWPEQVARGNMAWLDIAQTTALVWAFCLGAGESVRRLSNWEIGEPVCKWIWPK